MSDWNTLHFFSDTHFYSKVVTDLCTNGDLLRLYFESELGKHILWDNNNSKKRIEKIMDFCQYFDPLFKKHKLLYDITIRKKKIEEEYSTFITKKNQDEEGFLQANNETIIDLNKILTLIIFSECAIFNPHLILGRRIFTGCINAKTNSISEEIISEITDSEYGSIHSRFGSGIINWITHEDLKLLWLDKENLYATHKGSGVYFQEFLNFIEIAIENNLGFISGTNMNESVLQKVINPYIKINIDIKKLGFNNIN